MTSNVHQLPCNMVVDEDYGCIDCHQYPCMLWKAARGEMELPGEVGRGRGRSSHFATGLNIVRLAENFVILYSCEEGTPLTLIALRQEKKESNPTASNPSDDISPRDLLRDPPYCTNCGGEHWESEGACPYVY